jgi:mevalonate pyrophosphate decarboxylase
VVIVAVVVVVVVVIAVVVAAGVAIGVAVAAAAVAALSHRNARAAALDQEPKFVLDQARLPRWDWV